MTTTPNTILLIGGGANASYLGARLNEGGHEVAFLTGERRCKNLSEQGLVIKSPFGRFQRDVALVRPDQIKVPPKTVVLACRAHNLDDALKSAALASSANTAIVTMIDGVTHLARVQTHLSENPIVAGVVEGRLALDADAVVTHRGTHVQVRLGALGKAATPLVPAPVKTLSGRGIVFQASRCIRTDARGRFVFLGSGIAVSTLFGLPLTDLVRFEPMRRTLQYLRQEAAGVAFAVGVPIPRAVQEGYRHAPFMASEPVAAPPMVTDPGGSGEEAEYLLRQLLCFAKSGGAEASLLTAAVQKLDTTATPRTHRG